MVVVKIDQLEKTENMRVEINLVKMKIKKIATVEII